MHYPARLVPVQQHNPCRDLFGLWRVRLQGLAQLVVQLLHHSHLAEHRAFRGRVRLQVWDDRHLENGCLEACSQQAWARAALGISSDHA